MPSAIFNSMKPLIGITGNIHIMNEKDNIPGLQRDYVNRSYALSVKMSGGLSLIIPAMEDEEGLRSILGRIDGLILSGGYDIAPDLYGEEPRASLGYTMRDVDMFYLSAIRTARSMDLPLFGICKGHQAINVAFGGTLYQDIGEKGAVLKHSQSAPEMDPSHSVSIEEGTFLHSLLGSSAMVNSFHHQAIKAPAPGLKIAATSSDGIIEAFEMDGGRIIGVQWHPEMMAAHGNGDMLALFRYFVDICTS